MNTSQDTLLAEFDRKPLLRRLGAVDWLWAVALAVLSWNTLSLYGGVMDGYEIGITIGSALSLVWLGWVWRPMAVLSIVVAAMSLFAIWLYGDSLAPAETNFFLKYLIASQQAVMWMSALYVLATASYFFGLAANSDFADRVGTALTWSATAFGFTGLFVRWRESYLVHPDFGHIPVSNLYEVFILFCIITALLYLYYEQKSGTRRAGGFALAVISAAVGFILWYTFDRGAHEIQPLVPALQSYWMKIHVPANFVGYGAFSLAAMLSVAWLFRDRRDRAGKPSRLPEAELLDDITYKAIALGFAFFTIATVLGAMWAAEAWGGYWSWDPKETWALIVWLNYAGWLHLRLTKGWRGAHMAWWSIAGFFITLFAFLGVNMFLGGLHSYGEL